MVVEKEQARKAIGKEAGCFMVAEGASMVASLGVVAVFDNFIPKSITHAITSTVAKVCVMPFLDSAEAITGRFCKLEECKVDKTKPREERAENIARWMVIGGTAWLLSMGLKVRVRDWLNETCGLPHERRIPLAADAPMYKKLISKVPLVGSLVGMPGDAKMILLSDELVHYGSFIYMNNKGAKFTDGHIRNTESMLKKLGFSDRSAHEMSTWIWVWEMPNVAGMAAGMTAIAGKHAYGWPKGHTQQSFTDLVSGKAKSLAGESISK